MSSLLSSTAETDNSSSSSSKMRMKESSSSPSELMTGRKRNRSNNEEDGDSGSIPWLCWNHDWKGVCKRLESHPEEAQWTVSLSLRKVEKKVGFSLTTKNSSPLALACRYDAPLQVIQGLMEAAPERLSEMTPNRGTPIHDAAYVCTKLDVWSYLLSFDKKICAMQDVDGHVPLHILVKRTLSSTATTTETMELRMQMLQVLVQTYPPAVSMSNHDEYRETPLITALKSSCTSTSGGNLVEKEKWIFQVVQIMLQAYPSAAIHPIPSKEYYTAIHSAVFHGRSAEILYLLLHSDTTGDADTDDVVDIPNSLQETPLHIACMRGEGIKTLQYLVTPSTLLSRDANSLTPLHWLWIRHVDQTFDFHQQPPEEQEPQDFSYLISSSASSVDRIDEDYFCHVQRLDPPVDHRRMRHIPEHYYVYQQEVMEQIIASLQSSNNLRPPDRNVYFWSKVTKLLSSSSSSSLLLLHTACQLPSCIAIVQILLQLYPHHTSLRHTMNGNLPIHSIALRKWHPKEIQSIPQQQQQQSNQFAVDNNDDAIFNALNNTTNQQQPLFDPDYRIYDYINTTNNNNNNSNNTLSTRILLQQEMDKSRSIIYLEPYHILKLILQASDKRVCRTYNNDYQLPLHCAIDTLPSTTTTTSDDIPQLYTTFLDILSCYISQYPEALSRRDGKSKLYPFAQLIASCTENNRQPSNDELEEDEDNLNLLPLSLSYKLLRDNPSVLLH